MLVSCTTLDQSFRLGTVTGLLTGAAAAYAGNRASGRSPTIQEVGTAASIGLGLGLIASYFIHKQVVEDREEMSQQEIGITPIKFHDLRATFITQMLNNGVPLSKVMAIVGHSSLKTTQGYLRLSGKDIEGATESLNIVVPRAELTGDNVVSFKKR